MYRNEDKKAIADKWQGWTDFFQFGTLGLLFIFIFVLESLPKETARVFVWYGAGFLFVTATAGFLVGRVAIKEMSLYLNVENNRVGGLIDEAIKYEKSKKN